MPEGGVGTKTRPGGGAFIRRPARVWRRRRAVEILGVRAQGHTMRI
jgi:hypothetical protein